MLSTIVNACKAFFHQYQLKRIITAFAEYYQQHRAHHGIEQKIPTKLNQPRPKLSNQVKGKVIATAMPMFGGDYTPPL